MTNEKLKKEEVLSMEPTFLDNLQEASQWQNEYETIEVVRNGKKLFAFRVCGLSQEEIEMITKKSSIYTKTRAGLRGRDDFKESEFNSRVIHMGTHPDDSQALWDNKEARKAIGAMSPLIMIDKVFKPGEKLDIANRIMRLSGLDENGDPIQQEQEKDDLVKN